MADSHTGRRIIGQVLKAGQILVLIVASVIGLLFALVELIFAFPIEGRGYAVLGVMFVVGLIRRQPFTKHRRTTLVLLGILAFLAILHFVPWSTRKPFLKDLYSIKPGMTEADVRRIMGRYMEGTNWPAIYGGSPEGTGTLNDAGTGAKHATGSTPDGKLTIQNSLVFRHSTSGAFDSDWGIVALENGRVTGVSFSPD